MSHLATGFEECPSIKSFNSSNYKRNPALAESNIDPAMVLVWTSVAGRAVWLPSAMSINH